MPIPGASSKAPARVLARDRAYEAIKKAILARTIQPGERLDDDKLQAWLGMSKTPIRQALHALTVEGFVEVAAQAYTRVIEPRVDDAVLHLQTIGVFVLGVLDLTLGTLDQVRRDELIRDVDGLVAALENEDIDGSLTASQTYYTHLMESCPNRVLVDLAERTLTARGYYVVVAYRALGVQWHEAAGAYRRVRDALATGDAQGVADATKRVFQIEQPDAVMSAGGS
jgi:DNA-binding GntR family transcriptional regulator